MSNELNPCRFCGSKEVEFRDEYLGQMEETGERLVTPSIVCNYCGIILSHRKSETWVRMVDWDSDEGCRALLDMWNWTPKTEGEGEFLARIAPEINWLAIQKAEITRMFASRSNDRSFPNVGEEFARAIDLAWELYKHLPQHEKRLIDDLIGG